MRFILLTLTTVLLICPMDLIAQPGNPNTPAPLGGAVVLIAAGAALAISKKIKE